MEHSIFAYDAYKFENFDLFLESRNIENFFTNPYFSRVIFKKFGEHVYKHYACSFRLYKAVILELSKQENIC